ncbi:response regulator [Neorhizobium galegae]|uniref:response regulator n=1 Tax=Neorhizobium galegae TaxID=399 RepID=UPI0012744C04|nr:response regulator [Neorhizobium galegae]KAA9383940.1 response regulator [Neorhizobium galegae]KAB1115116.1 response regulator [Neorhizobium galegae]MCM2496764.1 response regulator [Neorhizobium galegae]MCQ1774958.1 response regulator [Neorhizobium galegae]MCQ1800239.1 response regulator [Neorhizobium galegae]
MLPAFFNGMPNAHEPPVRVLLAEDDFLIRLDHAGSIRALGWDVIEVSSADEGIELLRHGVRFDLVVTDLNMPGRYKGTDLARMVRDTADLTKVVIVSAENPPDHQLYDLFLNKPVWDIGPPLLEIMKKAMHGG